MQINEFNYNLPQELIAQYPLDRGSSRMLVYDKQKDKIYHKKFIDILDYINSGDALVINDTKVIPARLRGHKETGAKVEVLLLEEISKREWTALARPGSKLKPGTKIVFNDDFFCIVKDVLDEGIRIVEFCCDNVFDYVLKLGEMPLPPYIKREQENKDFETYQTVYSEKYGAVAAPTAGLHFTQDILERIKEKGAVIAPVTLHVGIGTFRPVEVENIREHNMHTERYFLSEDSAEKIMNAKKNGSRIIAVGTTSARVLESVVDENGKLKTGEGSTNIFIYPPYKFKMVDCLLTNFHLPKSTLLMMVCAFAGKDKVMEIYQKAIEEKYRFFSYGDCMFLNVEL
ncbi:tRNA preQ1(34) S-adenosylmethionine ribosyltransferase-isomerase QueA [bacterium]|nr:tRNA preQ1(34) S-adenosylmethionine ribosyltransferase-isomerase QueA [bacterium]